MKIRMIAIAGLYFLLVILLFCVPILWKQKAGPIDYPKLTEEWLKGAFEFVKIGAAFFIGTVIWAKYQKGVEDDKRRETEERTATKWNMVRNHMDEAAVCLARASRAQNKDQFNSTKDSFLGAFSSCSAYATVIKDAGTEIGSVGLLESVGAYQRDTLYAFQELVEDIKSGEAEWTIQYDELSTKYPGFNHLEKRIIM